jgi:hypothetical protein
MTDTTNSIAQLFTSALPQPQNKRPGNFFEALSLAWATALDRQADTVSQKAQVVSDGGDKISDMTLLTAEASKLNFMASSANTSMSDASKSLDTTARHS